MVETQPVEVRTAAVLLGTDSHWVFQLRDNMAGITQPGAVGLWGGHSDEGESPEATAIREVGEETPLELEPHELEKLGTFSYREARTLPSGLVEEEDVSSDIFLVRRPHVEPFDVKEGQGVLYVPLARLFMPSLAKLQMTTELDLTISHLVQVSHQVVKKALSSEGEF